MLSFSDEVKTGVRQHVGAYAGHVIATDISVDEKLKILSDAAKYDVACTSSGITRKGSGKLGNTEAGGICHTFTPDGRCISLLKILFTNECIYNCKYCVNRSSNDVPRATFTADEVCRLTVEFYRRNYIEGLFLSSGIIESPNHTVELLYETIYKLRVEYGFTGYVHVKGIPGASVELIEKLGYITDRMSVNLELPTAEGLKNLAPHKNRKNILKPMKNIQIGIKNNRLIHGKSDMKTQLSIADGSYLLESKLSLMEKLNVSPIGKNEDILPDVSGSTSLSREHCIGTSGKYFVPAGQSTQMIIGATDETDYHIINVTQALYNNYDLKRVFYSAFINVNNDGTLPSTDKGPELDREHRLYQADWLLRFYGFDASELLTEDRPYFNKNIDPKCDWAVRHLDIFPVEINKADYYTLLRVPGIGVKSARRIVAARKYGTLTFEDIKKIGVVLKRALYFITCNGKMMCQVKMEEKYITNHLIYNEGQKMIGDGSDILYTQMNLSQWGIC